MSVMTIEATIKNGQITLPKGISLPDNTRVYVVVPEMAAPQTAVIASPHLVYPEQVAHFQMQVREAGDADLQQQ